MAVSAAIDAPGPGSASTTKPALADSVAVAAGPSAPSVPRVAAVQDGGEGDDELGDDDSRDDDDEDEGEEGEPRLKYQRLGGSVPSLLSSDAAACLTVGERIIALGTHDGTVHLLDFQGNQVTLLLLSLLWLSSSGGFASWKFVISALNEAFLSTSQIHRLSFRRINL